MTIWMPQTTMMPRKTIEKISAMIFRNLRVAPCTRLVRVSDGRKRGRHNAPPAAGKKNDPNEKR